MWTAEDWDKLTRSLLLYLPRIGTALAVLIVFWLMARGLGRLVERLTRVRQLDADLTLYLGRTARFALLLFGAVTALGTLGVDVTALVAGLGLTTFAVGFAMKDILSNALAGVLILLYHPFRIGDRITVKGLEGTIVEINLRYTVLEAEGKKMLVPSAMMFSEPVTVVPRPSARTGPE